MTYSFGLTLVIRGFEYGFISLWKMFDKIRYLMLL